MRTVSKTTSGLPAHARWRQVAYNDKISKKVYFNNIYDALVNERKI